MVVIVDAGVRSAGETIAGMFKEDGRGIEGIGVPPHELAPVQAAEFLNREDTQIKRATDLLKSGLPKDLVRYTPP